MWIVCMLVNGLFLIFIVIFVLIWFSFLLLVGVFDLVLFKRWVSILDIVILFIFNDNKFCKCFILKIIVKIRNLLVLIII